MNFSILEKLAVSMVYKTVNFRAFNSHLLVFLCWGELLSVSVIYGVFPIFTLLLVWELIEAKRLFAMFDVTLRYWHCSVQIPLFKLHRLPNSEDFFCYLCESIQIWLLTQGLQVQKKTYHRMDLLIFKCLFCSKDFSLSTYNSNEESTTITGHSLLVTPRGRVVNLPR